VKDHEGALKKDNLFAGQHVSLDHFVCGTKGHLFTSMGKTSDSEMSDGGCVFIDSATGFIHLVLQVNLNTHEMLNAIHEFEQACHDHGVILNCNIPTMPLSLHLKAWQRSLNGLCK
jgi:hypothetical protein